MQLYQKMYTYVFIRRGVRNACKSTHGYIGIYVWILSLRLNRWVLLVSPDPGTAQVYAGIEVAHPISRKASGTSSRIIQPNVRTTSTDVAWLEKTCNCHCSFESTSPDMWMRCAFSLFTSCVKGIFTTAWNQYELGPLVVYFRKCMGAAA